MIKTKKDLNFYIAADRIMNGYPKDKKIKDYFKESFIFGGSNTLIIKYLYYMRKYAYRRNNHSRLFSINSIFMLWNHYWFTKYAVKCGFSIGYNSLGYGVVIPHYGTIVVNEDCAVGHFAVLHTCTCIAGGGKIIGDGLYLSTGSQIVGELQITDGVTIASHSLVNKSITEKNVLVAGAPATVRRTGYSTWYSNPNGKFHSRIDLVNKLIHNYTNV